MDVQGEIRRIHGLIEGHDKEIGGMRDQLSAIQSTVGSIDGKLDHILGSGPHPIVTTSQTAVEPSTNSIMGNAVKLANKPVVIHALYLGVGLLVVLWLLVSSTGRPAGDFVPWFSDDRRGVSSPKEPHP